MKTTRLAFLLAACCAARVFAGDTADPGVEARAKLLRERVLKQFTFGVAAPLEWLQETREKNGCQWDFHAQYFSGGAAKEHTWDTVFLDPWNKWENPQKVRGTWGEKFIKSTVEAGITPWITFYNLAQSNPADYKPGPAQATPVNARNTETMRSYWEQVKLLMQICGKYQPHPIVVQIEPDEWGHLLLTTRKGEEMFPLQVDVKVGATGLEELKGLPDNLRGYTQAWLKLRALYAPNNVLIACNPSAWDWHGSMSGAQWVKYFKECGAERFELAVLEFGDRDLGCPNERNAGGRPPPYAEKDFVTRFGAWDALLKWIEEFHKGTGLWVCMWQVAVGNTYFAACNQSDGHYCDGIAQGLLEDYPRNPLLGRFAAAGCAGFVFNPGQGTQTHVYDAKKDGVTNPPAIPGNLGNKSEYADDDGGYIRLRVGTYYKQPFRMFGPPAPAAATASSPPALPTSATTPPPPARPTADPAKLAEWDLQLRALLRAAVQAGKTVKARLSLMGQDAKPYRLAGVDETELKVDVEGNAMPVRWTALSVTDRAHLALAAPGIATEDPASLILAGVYLAFDGRSAEAEDFFARAALKDSAAVEAARKSIGLSK